MEGRLSEHGRTCWDAPPKGLIGWAQACKEMIGYLSFRGGVGGGFGGAGAGGAGGHSGGGSAGIGGGGHGGSVNGAAYARSGNDDRHDWNNGWGK